MGSEQGRGEEELVSPTGTVEETTVVANLASRPVSLNGKQITPYSNSFNNANKFLQGMIEAIQENVPDAIVNDMVTKPKPGAGGSAFGLIDELASTSDIVLMAYGHCGSCSVNTVKDSVELERQGIPTASFFTSEFIQLAQFEAHGRGMPGLPIVPIAHPVVGLSFDELKKKRITGTVVAETIEAVTSPPETVAAEYGERYSVSEVNSRPQFQECNL